MITVPEKVLICSLILTGCGILFAIIAGDIKGHDLPIPLGLFVILSLVLAPAVAVASALWIVCTL